MKTSWNRIKQLERYLLRQSTPEEDRLLEAQLTLDPSLREDLRGQRQTYDIVRRYGRQQLRREIEAVEHQLFHTPQHRGFQRMIRRLFT